MRCRLTTFGVLLLLLTAVWPASDAFAQRDPEPRLTPMGSLSHYWNDSLLYVIAPGARLQRIFSDGFESGDVSRFDLNGNGSRDVVVFRDDIEGNPAELIVYDLALLDSLFTLDFLSGGWPFNPAADVSLRGFYDLNNDGLKDVVFGGEGMAIYDPREPDHPAFIFADTGECRYLGVADVNQDGILDLVIANTRDRQIEVYNFYDQ